MQKGDAVQLQRHLPFSDGKQGEKAYATLILLWMVGHLCIGELWGSSDGLENTASYPAAGRLLTISKHRHSSSRATLFSVFLNTGVF